MARERKAEVSEAPALLQAVRATVSTLETRARAYRWAVICIGVAIVSPVLLALALLSWRPLSYVALFVPAVGVFLVSDSWAVLSWQRHILQMWIRDDFKLSDLRQTLQGMRHLPAGTVKGMLDRLPASERPEQLDQLSAPAKSSVAAGCLERAHWQDRRTLLSTIGTTLLVCSLAAAVSIQIFTPLLIALVGLLLIVSSQWAARW
jgi:hypothetical protein